MKKNVVGWFEIPVTNMDRAIKFYKSVFGYKLERNQMGPLDMAWFPMMDGCGAGGSLVCHEDFYQPQENGTLIYFDSEDVNIEIAKIEAAGGKMIQPKTLIAKDIGYMAVFIDSEGNRIALHSRK